MTASQQPPLDLVAAQVRFRAATHLLDLAERDYQRVLALPDAEVSQQEYDTAGSATSVARDLLREATETLIRLEADAEGINEDLL